MFSSHDCHGRAEPVHEHERRALADVDVVGLASVDPDPLLVALPVDVEPLGAPATAVVAVRPRVQQAADGLDRARIGHRALRSSHRDAHRHRHRLDAPPLLGQAGGDRPPPLRRRDPVRRAGRVARSTGSSPSSSRRSSRRATASAHILGSEPYPGAVETVRAWHEAGHFIHITSPPLRRRPRRDGALAGADRPALRRASTAPTTRSRAAGRSASTCWSTTRRTTCAARSTRGITARDAAAPVEPRAVRDRGRRLRRGLAGAGAQPRAGAAMKQLPARARTCATTCPRSSPTAGSRTGALRARRGRARQDALRVPLPLLVPLRRRGRSRTSPPTAAPCSSPTTAGALPPDATMILKAVKEEQRAARGPCI